MENNRLTLDTNIILYYFQGKPGPVQLLSGKESLEIYASIITQTELLSYSGMTNEESRWLNEFLGEMEIIPYTNELLSLVVDFRQRTKLKLPDSIIAATAIHTGTTLVTCDRDLAEASFPNFNVLVPAM